MKKLIALLLLIWGYSFAQTTSGEQYSKQQTKLDALKGTYEIVNKSRGAIMLPSDLADIIEKNRKETDQTVITLNEQVEVTIYPKNKVDIHKD